MHLAASGCADRFAVLLQGASPATGLAGQAAVGRPPSSNAGSSSASERNAGGGNFFREVSIGPGWAASQGAQPLGSALDAGWLSHAVHLAGLGDHGTRPAGAARPALVPPERQGGFAFSGRPSRFRRRCRSAEFGAFEASARSDDMPFRTGEAGAATMRQGGGNGFRIAGEGGDEPAAKRHCSRKGCRFPGCVVRRATVFDRPYCRRGTIDVLPPGGATLPNGREAER